MSRALLARWIPILLVVMAASDSAAFSVGTQGTSNCDDCCAIFGAHWCLRCSFCLCSIPCEININCAAAQATDRAPTLAAIQNFRIKVLQTTQKGRALETFYERLSPRVVNLLLLDTNLRASAGKFLEELAPVLSHLAGGTGNQVVVTNSLVATGKSFIADLVRADRERGDNKLAPAIDGMLHPGQADRYIGMTVTAAWSDFLARSGLQPSNRP